MAEDNDAEHFAQRRERTAGDAAAEHAELFERGVIALERIALCMEEGPLTEGQKIGRLLEAAGPPSFAGDKGKALDK